MKIIKNFLQEEDFLRIQKVLLDSNFPWFYNSGVVNDLDRVNNFQFTHTFYADNLVCSNYFNLIKPIVDNIKLLSILSIKANLLTRTNLNVEHGFHTDYVNQKNVTTGIFYVNDNNGYTKFKNGKISTSEKNKFIEFNSTNSHTGSSCTDENIRVIINFNYIKPE